MHKQGLHYKQARTPCSLLSPWLLVGPPQSKAMGKHYSKGSRELLYKEFFMKPQLRSFTFEGTAQIPITGTPCPTPVSFLTPSSNAALLSETERATGQEGPDLFHTATHLQI